MNDNESLALGGFSKLQTAFLGVKKPFHFSETPMLILLGIEANPYYPNIIWCYLRYVLKCNQFWLSRHLIIG
jgi:hypothetical protein